MGKKGGKRAKPKYLGVERAESTKKARHRDRTWPLRGDSVGGEGEKRHALKKSSRKQRQRRGTVITIRLPPTKKRNGRLDSYIFQKERTTAEAYIRKNRGKGRMAIAPKENPPIDSVVGDNEVSWKFFHLKKRGPLQCKRFQAQRGGGGGGQTMTNNGERRKKREGSGTMEGRVMQRNNQT